MAYKKYIKIEKGIYSYRRESDPDKHICYYYSSTNSEGKTRRYKSEHTDIRNVRKERDSMKLAKKETKKNPTLNDVAMNYISAKTGKPMPDAEYKKYLKNFESGLGKKRVASITEKDVARFRASLESKGLQPRARLIQLKSLLRAGGSDVKIQIKAQPNKQKRFFTEDELEIIFTMAEKINPQLSMFIKTLLYTGQRPKNVLQLEIIDIDFKKGLIDFQEIKGQPAEYIPISSKLRPLLEDYTQGRRGKVFTYSHDYLAELSQEIFDTFNRPLYYIDGMSKDEEKEARKVVYKAQRHRWASFYSLRHTTAVNIIKNTGSVYKAQQILRHSDIKMTQVYAQLLDDEKQGAVDAI